MDLFVPVSEEFYPWIYKRNLVGEVARSTGERFAVILNLPWSNQ
jgi:hypothetical protein